MQSTLCGVLQPRTGQAGGKMLAAGLGAVAAWNEMPARYCCMPSDYDLQEFVLELMLR